MGLLNIGRGKGPQIIQLFGRGVRLKGKEFSLKREETPDYLVKNFKSISAQYLRINYLENRNKRMTLSYLKAWVKFYCLILKYFIYKFLCSIFGEKNHLIKNLFRIDKRKKK